MGILENILQRFTLKKSETVYTTTNDMIRATAVQQTGFSLSPFDYSKAEKNIDEIAEHNVWVGACVRAIARNSIKPILKIYDPATNEDVENEELLDIVRRPHPYFNESDFRKYTANMYNIDGNAFIAKIRSGEKLIALQPLPSANVKLDSVAIQQNIVRYIYSDGKKEHPLLLGKDLIVWKDTDWTSGYFTGTSKLKHLLFTIINKNMADRFNKSTLENGGERKGVLATEQTLQDADIAVMRKELKKYEGPDNAGKIKIFGGGVKWQDTGSSIADMGFENLNKLTKEEVLSIFKVPPVELGLTDSVNYANAKEQRKLFWETTMIPIMDSFAETLSHAVLQGEFGLSYKYYYDYSAIEALQQDLNVKLQSAILMQTMGCYDDKTITGFLDLPEPVEGVSGNDGTTGESRDNTPPTDGGTSGKSLLILPDKYKASYRDQMKMEFFKEHFAMEKVFEKQVSKFFLDERNKLFDFIKTKMEVKAPQDLTDIVNFISERNEEAKTNLKKIGTGLFTRISQTVVKNMIGKYGLVFKEGVATHLKITQHTNNFVDINDTVSRQLKEQIDKAYLNGISAGKTTAQIAQDILNATRNTYKMAEKRAVAIARTETTSASNDMMLDNFKENGVEKKEWLTSHDERVRGNPAEKNKPQFNHFAMDGVEEDISIPFRVPAEKGGGFESIEYPGDMANGSAGNIVNCRCSVLPL